MEHFADEMSRWRIKTFKRDAEAVHIDVVPDGVRFPCLSSVLKMCSMFCSMYMKTDRFGILRGHSLSINHQTDIRRG